MNKEKIIQGYDSDVCNIDLALVLDTVVISNHPIMMQRAMAYSNHSIQT